jgi:RNA polymerase sigma factor (sigma-70 family)
MSVSWWRLGVLALASLAVLSPQAPAQRFNGRGPAAAASINPNFLLAPGLTLQQAAFNTAVLGRAYQNVPPYALGYNPYVRSVGYPYPPIPGYGGGGALPVIAPAYNPYALSTAPGGYGGNPYLGGASLATDAASYSLSTAGGGYGGGYGGYSPTTPYGYGVSEYSGGYLRGLADVTAATGQFYKDQQQARILREQSRMAALDTQRRRIMDEAMYERMRPTAQNMRDAELTTDLNRVLVRLSVRCRSLLKLRYGLGYGPTEVAEQMGYQTSSIRKVTNRCLAALTRQLLAIGFQREP